MRWEWGEERRSLQDGPRNDPGNPWRQATLGPVPCMLEVSGPGAHCKEHLNKGHRSELGSSRGNGDKSKKPKKTLVLSISIGLFMTIWKDSLLQFYSSSVVVPKIGTISAIEILKFVRNESNSLWSFSGHFFFFCTRERRTDVLIHSTAPFSADIWGGLLFCFAFSWVPLNTQSSNEPFRRVKLGPETLEFYWHMTDALDPNHTPQQMSQQPILDKWGA